VAAGGDPAKERHADIDADAAAVAARKQAMQADSLTFANLIDAWETRHLCYRRAYYRAEAVRALRFSLATLANVPAHAVGVAKVRQALEAIPRSGVAAGNNPPAGSDRPRGEAMARRVRDNGRAMYAWAMKNDLLTTNPFAKVTAEGRDQPRERVLSDSEIGEIWRATDTLGWPWGAYIRFLLLTLQREGETAGMRWAELGPELATWELPGERTKNGKPHLVHLAEPARAILRTLPRLAGAELVFTTTGKTPVSGFSAAKARLAACRT
jgi:integrase